MSTRYIYFVAASLDGFIADDADGLDWLLSQDIDEEGPGSPDVFTADVGACVMGATTFAWLLDHLDDPVGDWPYGFDTFLFTHRAVDVAVPGIRPISGSPERHRADLEAAADGRDVWLVGGGGLVADFARAGMLDEIRIAVAPVTLGSGRPLLPAALDLELVTTERNRAFVTATYRVRGTRG